MAKNESLVVEGFYFEDEDLLKEAKKEAEGVRYMKSRVDLQHPQKVLQIYRRVLEQGTFQTQVGYAYLRELQDYLYAMPQVPREDILPIPVQSNVRVINAAGTTETLRSENKKSRRFLHWSVLVNCLLVVVIAVMFAIAMSSSSPTVLNYEKVLVDRYSSWEQELKEREATLLEKERNLDGYDD